MWRGPLSDKREERELIRRYRGGDEAAKQKLVEAFHRLVRSIVSQYSGPSHNDLMAAGLFGFCEAISRFNENRDYRLSTYAKYWIRKYILLAIQGWRREPADYEAENLIAEEPATVVPWRAPKYGGMSESSARRSYEASLEDRAKSESINPSLAWVDMSKWDNEPLPKRKWAICDRVPLNQAGLFSGEGGTGKSIIELTKNCAHVLGKDWLGSLPEMGPAFYLGAEDDVDELHIRIAGIKPQIVCL